MKKLIIAILMITPNVNALECGESEVSTSGSVMDMEVTTDVPAFLKGATITITKANGSSETVKAEEYMVVKRKHNRPVVHSVTKEEKRTCTVELIKSEPEPLKNIVSLKAVDGYSDVKKKEDVNGVELKVERQVGLGVVYQRNLSDNLYLGGEVDSNRGLGVLLGLGF